MPQWTPIQARILDVLSDGMYHKQAEVLECLGDPMADVVTLRQHICNIREKLRPIGEVIDTQRGNGETTYKHYRVVTLGD